MVLYPGTGVRHVRPVSRGARVRSFFWVQSMIRDEAKRALLFDMNCAISSVRQATETASRHSRYLSRASVFFPETSSRSSRPSFPPMAAKASPMRILCAGFTAFSRMSRAVVDGSGDLFRHLQKHQLKDGRFENPMVRFAMGYRQAGDGLIERACAFHVLDLEDGAHHGCYRHCFSPCAAPTMLIGRR